MKAVAVSDELRRLNAICPYFTMFPLEFPIGVLHELGAAGKRTGVVVDPFSGRGTTNLAALSLGLNTVAVDSAPVGAAISQGKLAGGRVSATQVEAEAIRMIADQEPDMPSGAFWKSAFHPATLRSICAIRGGLISARSTPVRSVLRALMLGILHGPLRVDGSSSYLSNQSPRTYAPKPRYALQFWRSHELKPPKIDVVQAVRVRAQHVLGWSPRRGIGRTVRGDSRSTNWSKILGDMGKIRWIVTSPPYYGLRTYRPDQWLREWFLGGPSHVVYDADQQLRHSSPENFAADLSLVWSGIADCTSSDARLIFRFGAINDRPISPRLLAKASLDNTPWKIDEIRSAGPASRGRRQAGTFARTIHPAFTEIDVWCSRA